MTPMASNVFGGMKIFQKQSEVRYEAARKEDPDFELPVLEPPTLRQHRVTFLTAICILPWVTTSILAVLLLCILLNDRHHMAVRTYENGWATDFVSAREVINTKQIIFNGGPSFYENGTMYVPNPDPIKYVGEPNSEIDENWEILTRGRYVLISEEEARASWGGDISAYWSDEVGGFITGFDMFHTLHCLNNMRKLLDIDHYKGTIETDRVHSDHCIEQMRQYIMCVGDMTPIPTKYYPQIDRNYVDSDQPHTCRNFDQLRSWLDDRAFGQARVMPVIKDKIHT